MRKSLILTMAAFMILFLSGSAFALGEGEYVGEWSAGGHYVTFTGDEGDNGYGIFFLYEWENWLFDVGWSTSDGNTSGTLNFDDFFYTDLSYLWHAAPDNEQMGNVFAGLGIEALFGDGTQYGGVAQLGYKWENGMLVRAKYGLLSDDVQPLFLSIGWTF